MKNIKGKTRIYTAFLWHRYPPGRFFPQFDHEARRDYVWGRLKSQFEDIEFIGGAYIANYDELKEAAEREDIDAILVYVLSPRHLPSSAAWYTREEAEIAPFKKHPMLVVADPANIYAAMEPSMPFLNVAKRQKLPLIAVAGTQFEEVRQPLHLIRVIHQMKESKILCVGVLDSVPETSTEMMIGVDQDRIWTLDPDRHFKILKDVFGTEVILMDIESFKKEYYDKVGESEANQLADKWIGEATAVRGPTVEEIVEHAKWPPTLKKAIDDVGADAVVVKEDGRIPSFPCLAMSVLKDEGIPCSPTADLDSTVTQLLMYYLAGRAGFVNDTGIDPPRGRIIHAYCCAPRKWEGPDSQSEPYELRHCCAGGVSCAVDIRSHYGKFCTSVKCSLSGKLMVIHQGKLIERIPRQVDPGEFGDWGKVAQTFKWPGDMSFEDVGCQNKFVVETNAETAFENYQKLWDVCGKHRNLYLGDFKKEIKHLTTLLQLEFIEEDRDYVDLTRIRRFP